jgi:hypothetical protein
VFHGFLKAKPAVVLFLPANYQEVLNNERTNRKTNYKGRGKSVCKLLEASYPIYHFQLCFMDRMAADGIIFTCMAFISNCHLGLRGGRTFYDLLYGDPENEQSKMSYRKSF